MREREREREVRPANPTFPITPGRIPSHESVQLDGDGKLPPPDEHTYTLTHTRKLKFPGRFKVLLLQCILLSSLEKCIGAPLLRRR